MFGDRHVELERTNRGNPLEQLFLTAAAQSSHSPKQRSPLSRSEVGAELELVLTKRRRPHVPLQPLPRRLVVECHRQQPRDLRQRCQLFNGRRGGRRRGRSRLNIRCHLWSHCAIRGVLAAEQGSGQRHNKNSFAMSVLHTSSSASDRTL